MRDRPIHEMTVEELEREIAFHDHQYHVLSAPVIPDEEFDLLTRRLKDLKPDSPVLHRVGASAADGTDLGRKVVHASPMLSLDKCYSDEEYREWLAFLDRSLAPAGQAAGLTVTISPKIDGVAASLRYGPDGQLAVAATRGDGVAGEDFTFNARLVAGIPWTVPQRGVEVRGEVFMKRGVFEGRYKAAGFSNPRNLTAGTIKQKEGNRAQLLDLTFHAYDIHGTAARTEQEKRAALQSLGFLPVPATVDRADAVPEHFAALATARDSWDFEADGVVVKLDDVASHALLGGTAHHPRYAIAYKFQGDTGITRLLSVEWSVSRTGTITPVANVEPIVLSGACVSRSTLHNIKIFTSRGLRTGDRVQLTRRGGVIPNLEASLGGGTDPIPVPRTCPSCGREALLLAPQLFIAGVRLPFWADADMIRSVARSRRPSGRDASLLSGPDQDNAVARRGGDPTFVRHLTWVTRGENPTPVELVRELKALLQSMPSVAFPGHRVSALLVFDPAVEACLRILGQVLSVLKEESLLLRVLPVVQTTRPDVPDAVQATLPGAAPDERSGEGRRVGDSVRKWHDFTGCIEQAVAPVVAAGARLVVPAPAQDMESLTRMWGAKAGEVSDGVLSCSQPGACRAAVVGTLEHFVGTLGVDGFGPRVVESLYDAGLLRSREDFFTLAREQLTPLERMGDLLASKLVEKVQAARALPLATFLEALGIEELARTVSAKLASRCPDVPSVLALSEADLRSMLVKEKAEGEQERASRIAFLVYHGLRREAGAISRLLEHVTVRPRSTPTAPAPGQDAWKFAGASFVFTGKMRTLERKAAQAEVVARSGLAPPDVTRDLSFLVVGDEGSPLFGQGAKGSKLVTAEKHNSKGASIRIISETEFLEMLKA